MGSLSSPPPQAGWSVKHEGQGSFLYRGVRRALGTLERGLAELTQIRRGKQDCLLLRHTRACTCVHRTHIHAHTCSSRSEAEALEPAAGGQRGCGGLARSSVPSARLPPSLGGSVRTGGCSSPGTEMCSCRQEAGGTRCSAGRGSGKLDKAGRAHGRWLRAQGLEQGAWGLETQQGV